MAMSETELRAKAKAAEDNTTTIVLNDPELIAQLEVGVVKDFVQFRDANGRLIHVLTGRLPGSPPPDVMAKLRTLTKEELEERRKNPEPGKPMSEVIAEFKARLRCTE